MKGKDFFIHKTAIIDENVLVGKNSKIWHFSHIQSNSKIGNECTLGQNVNVSKNDKTILITKKIDKIGI